MSAPEQAKAVEMVKSGEAKTIRQAAEQTNPGPQPVAAAANTIVEALRVPLPIAPYDGAEPPASVCSAVDRVLRLVQRLLDGVYHADDEMGDAVFHHMIAGIQAKRLRGRATGGPVSAAAQP
jgi:hypothetical protein